MKATVDLSGGRVAIIEYWEKYPRKKIDEDYKGFNDSFNSRQAAEKKAKEIIVKGGHRISSVEIYSQKYKKASLKLNSSDIHNLFNKVEELKNQECETTLYDFWCDYD